MSDKLYKENSREFLKTTSILGSTVYFGSQVKASAQASSKNLKTEALALNGGSPAVTAQSGDATKWPIYGDEEIKLVTELIKSPGYAPIEEFEGAWKKYFDCPFAKAHCNGTNALTSTYLH
jgi:hypothetical protein